MNKVFLIGRLTKEPELKYTPNGKAVATFTLAVNRPFTQNGNSEADFINIVVWGKSAENAEQYLKKGQQAAVDGRLQIRNYEDNNGNKRYVTEVIADRVEFLGQARKDGNELEQAQEAFGQEIVFNNEDIPF